MQFNLGRVGLKGRVKWAVVNPDGSLADGGTLVPDQPSNNLILEQGRDNLGSYETGEIFTNCAVGTGTSTPATSQVELDNEKARTNNISSDGALSGTDYPADGASPYTATMKRGFDFPQGSLDSSTDGDYTEVGFSHSTSAGQNLFSRALFKDESGNTIAITVASDQILRVAYELDLTLEPSAKTSGSFDITNIGTINYEALGGSSILSFTRVVNDGGINRASLGTFEPARWATGNMRKKNCAMTSQDTSFHNGWVSSTFDGAGTAPTPEVSTETASVSYQGSGVWQYQVTFATDQGNLSGIKNITLSQDMNKDGGFGVRFRINDGDEFDKENTHELILTFEISFTIN